MFGKRVVESIIFFGINIVCGDGFDVRFIGEGVDDMY